MAALAFDDLANTDTPLSEDEATDAVMTLAPGAVITSGYRTPDHNAAIGGVAGSLHTRGQAQDIVLPQGVSPDQFHQHLLQAGYPVTEFLVEKAGDPHSTGPHVHWGWGPKGQQGASALSFGDLAQPQQGPMTFDDLAQPSKIAHATSEDSGYAPGQLIARNQPWVRPGAKNFSTPLSPPQEQQFRQWVSTKKVPFDPSDPTPDYDMRGFWKALQTGDKRAQTAIDPNDGKMHFPDYWKTPYSATFSAESQWANPKTAPKWNDKDQLVTPSGTVVYDDRTRAWNNSLFPAAAPEGSWYDAIASAIKTTPERWKQLGAGALRWFAETNPQFLPRSAEARDFGPPLVAYTPKEQEDVKKIAAFSAKVYGDAQADIAANTPNLPAGSAKYYANQITAGTIDLVPLLAATAVTKNPAIGAALMGGQAGVQKYGAARAQGRTADQASMDAMFSTLVNGSLGALPLGVLMKPGQSFLAKTLQSAGTFGATNVVTEALQIGYDKGLVDPNMTFADAWGRLRDAGIVGTLQGAFLGAGHAGLEAAVGRLQAGVKRPGAPQEGRQEPTVAPAATALTFDDLATPGPARHAAGPVHADVEATLGLARPGRPPEIQESNEIAQNPLSGVPQALSSPELAAPSPGPSFRTTPAAIANEHALEVARLEAEGSAAAAQRAVPLPSMDKPAAPAPEAAAPSSGGVPQRPLEQDVAVTAAGREVPVRYALVEAAHLVPSQTQDGNPNPNFPADLQPRDRSRAVSQAQIASIAQNVNPRLLDHSVNASDGAPIIAPSGIVESGNGRSLALQRAYAQGLPSADRYRDYLASQGYPVEGMTAPVLVRVREGDLIPSERQAFVREANQSGQLGYSATERAMNDAAALPDHALDLYRGGDIEGAGNRDFVRAFLREAVPETEHAQMIDQNGALSQEAGRRIRAALLAKAYGDPDLVAHTVESHDANTKAIGGAMTDAAGEWARMRAQAAEGDIPTSLDQTGKLLEAVNLVSQARSEGRNVAEYVGQTDMFSGEAVDPDVEAWLRLMFRNTKDWTQPVGREKLADALRYYAREAQKVHAGPNLLGTEPLGAQDIASAAKERQYGGRPEGQSPSLGFGEDVRARSGHGTGPETQAPEADRGAAVAPGPGAGAQDNPVNEFGRTAVGFAFEPRGEIGAQHSLRHEADAFARAAGTDLRDPAAAAGTLANYVLARGRRSGVENLAIYDPKSGSIFDASSVGKMSAVSFSPRTAAGLSDPTKTIVSFHNHPSYKSFSLGDHLTLLSPAEHTIFAIGHNGTWYGAKLNGRVTGDQKEAFRAFGDLLKSVDRHIFSAVNPDVQAKRIDVNDANEMHAHLVSEALARAGLIQYLTNYRVPERHAPLAERLVQEGAHVAAALANEIPGIDFRAADGLHRPAGSVGFQDAVGILLGRTRGDAGQRAAAPGEGASPGRAPAYRRPEQLRLLEDENHYEHERPPFYSALTRAIEDVKLTRAPAKDWLGLIDNLRNKGVKQEEIDWSGVKQWLGAQTGPVTRDQILDHLRANEVMVEEVLKARRGTLASRELGGETKFEQHTLAGGKNYRELLLTLPSDGLYGKAAADAYNQLSHHLHAKYGDGIMNKATPEERARLSDLDRRSVEKPPRPQFKSGHFDEPNVLAHIRFDDRIGPNGEKILHIAEVQSDWHQKGRREGYRHLSELPEGYEFKRNSQGTVQIWRGEERVGATFPNERAALNFLGHEGVPNAPFKATWHELSMKRMLRYAAEHGYDRVTWDTGDTQTERYDLSKHVSRIDAEKRPDGNYGVEIFGKDGQPIGYRKSYTPVELAEHVGKDMADKIANDLKESGAEESYSGLDLKVGGDGMKGFYDRILPQFLSRYVKKWGTNVVDTHIPSGDTSRSPAHGVDITPAMRESVMQGQAFFEDKDRYRAERSAKARTDSGKNQRTLFEDPARYEEIPVEDRRVLERAAQAGGWLAKYGAKPTADGVRQAIGRAFQAWRQRSTAVPKPVADVFASFPEGFEETPTSVPPSRERLADQIRRHADAAMDLVHDVQMLVAPMAEGSSVSRAAAKDFANMMRLGRWHGQRMDENLKQNFDHAQRRKMWEAADRESVARQKGETAVDGLSTLAPDERRAVLEQQADAQNVWKAAKDVGIVKGEGLPSYVPRMMVEIADTGVRRLGEDEGVRSIPGIGRNLKTTTGQAKHRKYLTTEETEGAGSKRFGTAANVVRDIRTLPLATMRLREAVAGRALINKIKEIGARTGEDTVVEGHEPAGSPHQWFTLDHPSFKTWRPKFITDELTGKIEAAKDQNGETVFERVPIYVRSDFEGPLKAVLSRDTGKVYNALMDLKGKAMMTIMYSPLIHNAVEWGRALPAMPGKVLTLRVYFEGNRAKRDPETMTEAIMHGLVPIGHQGGYQDITSIAGHDNIKAGRSWTAKALGAVPGLFSRDAKEAVYRAVDRMGDVWHNTLLWDRVGDLQMGLYTNLRDQMLRKGYAPDTAQYAAAHFANRYAGALPIEAMSGMARKIANLTLFSRTYTLGNLGAMKDVLTGLPRDVQAQIEQTGGIEQLAKIKSAARRKALAILATDIALFYAANSILQSAISYIAWRQDLSKIEQGYVARLNAEIHRVGENPLDLLNPFGVAQSLSATSENEQGREDRVLVGYDHNGTAIYARNPIGKIGEEFKNWLTSPLETLKKKLGTFARPTYETITNDAGFGRHVYDPNAKGVSGLAQNIGRIVETYLGSQVPLDSLKSGWNALTGKGSEIDTYKTLGPLAGVTFSKGAPGGPAVGALYELRREHDAKVQEALPGIIEKIKSGDVAGARADMRALALAPGLQNYYVRTTLSPRLKMNTRSMRQLLQHATPEERARIQDLRGAQP